MWVATSGRDLGRGCGARPREFFPPRSQVELENEKKSPFPNAVILSINRGMKARPLFSGLISGAIGFLGTCALGAWDISHSTSSTACIGYVFLPFYAFKISILFFLFGYCAHFAVVAFFSPRRPKRGLLAIGIALALLLSFLYWLGNGLLLCKEVDEVRNLDREGITRFLETSPLKENKYALNAILERPDMDAQTLYKIAQIPSPELHQRIGSSFPVMGKNTRGLAVMRLVARHPNVDAQTLALLANSPDDYVLGDVAGNPKTPPEILPRLAQKGGQLIEWSLALNPNTPPEILHKLAASSNEYTRAGVARNSSTSQEDLELLARDSEWNVRDSVLMNPKCSSALKETLRNDPDERIRRRFK